jgi:hypothetical protein
MKISDYNLDSEIFVTKKPVSITKYKTIVGYENRVVPLMRVITVFDCVRLCYTVIFFVQSIIQVTNVIYKIVSSIGAQTI